MKLTERSYGVDKDDYGPCPSCTHTLEGRTIQSAPLREARIREYNRGREWERDPWDEE